MRIRRSLPMLLLMGGCVPLTRAHLSPEASLKDIRAWAERIPGGGWRIRMSLPDPGGRVGWVVTSEEAPMAVRSIEGERAVYTWEIPAARWKEAPPFTVRIQAAGLDEVVRLGHPRTETTLSDGATILLEILTLPFRIPHG